MEQGLTFFFDWEVALMEALQGNMGQAGIVAAKVMTFLGEEMAMIALLGFIYWCHDKELGRDVGLAIVIGVVLNPLIKNMALRRRPYFDNPGIKCLKPVDSGADIYDVSAQGFSFPSGHSMNSTIIFGSVAYHVRKNWLTATCVIIPLLVGTSRFALGVHYPTDVIVGWACGAITVFAVPHMLDRWKNRYLTYACVFAVSLVGIFYCRTADYFTGIGIMSGFFLADPFERRFVNFETTGSVPFCVFRMLGGLIVYFVLNTLLKLPFSKEFLESASTGAFLVRFCRYAVVTFVVIGVYPLAFRLENRFSKADQKAAQK